MLPVSTPLSGLPQFSSKLDMEGGRKGRGSSLSFFPFLFPALLHPGLSSMLLHFSSPHIGSPCFPLPLLDMSRSNSACTCHVPLNPPRCTPRTRPASPSHLIRFLALLLPRSSSHFPSSACICHVRLTLSREFPHISPCLCRSRSATPCF